jgi:hypothetical protein
MLYWWKSFQIFITKKISYYLRFVWVYFLILSIYFFLNSVGCHGVFRGTVTLMLVFSRI